MFDFSVPMALVDFLPVLMFGAAGILLQKDLYGKMLKGPFALFAAGTINVFSAGFLKALWKLLYAAGICDFRTLSTLFFPLQSIGFLLAGLGIVLMLTPRHKSAMLTVAPPVFSGVPLFITMMVLGLAGICTSLSILAVRMRRKLPAVLFAISFLCSLGMGYLSGKDSASAMINWIEQGINCMGQGLFLLGTVLLHKSGLREFPLTESSRA